MTKLGGSEHEMFEPNPVTKPKPRKLGLAIGEEESSGSQGQI
jgi:hypothetical protein